MTSSLKEIWETMGSISELQFKSMPKSMQENYDAICNWLEKRWREGKS
jgi:hypothetical protein